MSDLWLHRFAVVLAICTLFLVVAGASVVSKEAGLSVPDWPLSYGKVMPEMKDGVFFEHGHRMIATTVGFLTIILTVWMWRSNEPRWLKHLSSIALLAVIAQGVLGGLTVKMLLPKSVSISHACLAQLFFCVTVAIAVVTSRSWKSGPPPAQDRGTPALRSLSFATAAVAFVQVALGAAYRHGAIGVLPHVLWAAVVILLVMLMCTLALSQFRHNQALRQAAIWVLSLTGAQVILGVAALTARVMTADSPAPGLAMVWLTVAHTALGAVVLAGTVVMSIQAARHAGSVKTVSTGRLAQLGHVS
ncbi:MAG: COX15/CtaA family protein [Bryobacterales bacterium]|nr:COX15/CtaA family protein [Bryobacterales bacterium]